MVSSSSLKDPEAIPGETTGLLSGKSDKSGGGLRLSPRLNLPFGDEEEPLGTVPEWTRREVAVAGLGAISFGTSAAAMLLYPHPIVLVSGFVGCGISVYVAFMQQKITEVRTLSETNETFEREVSQLQEETDQLQSQVQKLQNTVNGLQNSKKQLEQAKSVSGKSLKELESQLKQLEATWQTMEQRVDRKILMNLMDLAKSCDESQDGELSKAEISACMDKIEGLNNIIIDRDAVTKLILENGSGIDAILRVVQDLLSKEDLSNSKLFQKK